jgi:hypothetical protein
MINYFKYEFLIYKFRHNMKKMYSGKIWIPNILAFLHISLFRNKLTSNSREI